MPLRAPCNLAKSAWGLSHYLIAKRGYSSPEVKVTVQRWLEFVNPTGFTGNACFKGGCTRPFAKNGCSGMDATRVIRRPPFRLMSTSPAANSRSQTASLRETPPKIVASGV